MTNQPTKVRTCQSKKSAPSTTNVVINAMATVRTTREVGACAHPPSWIGMDVLGPADTIGGIARDCACGSPGGSAVGFVCVSACVVFSLISLAPTILRGATPWPRRVGWQSNTSCAGSLTFGHLIGSHLPL